MFKTNKIIKIAAFTLAEVLIVVGIIGIIAELVMPGLIANTEKQIFVTKLKKAYASFNEILNNVAVDSGCPGDLSCFIKTTSSTEEFSAAVKEELNIIAKQFKTTQICRIGDRVGKCYPETIKYNLKGTMSGYTTTTIPINIIYFVTVDGISYRVGIDDCRQKADTQHLKSVCGSVEIDVNGLKPPNMYGRDVFVYYITNGAGPLLYPMGGKEFEYNSSTLLGYWGGAGGHPGCCGNTETEAKNGENETDENWIGVGYCCAARIMEKGWTMDY